MERLTSLHAHVRHPRANVNQRECVLPSALSSYDNLDENRRYRRRRNCTPWGVVVGEFDAGGLERLLDCLHGAGIGRDLPRRPLEALDRFIVPSARHGYWMA